MRGDERRKVRGDGGGDAFVIAVVVVVDEMMMMMMLYLDCCCCEGVYDPKMVQRGGGWRWYSPLSTPPTGCPPP